MRGIHFLASIWTRSDLRDQWFGDGLKLCAGDQRGVRLGNRLCEDRRIDISITERRQLLSSNTPNGRWGIHRAWRVRLSFLLADSADIKTCAEDHC